MVKAIAAVMAATTAVTAMRGGTDNNQLKGPGQNDGSGNGNGDRNSNGNQNSNGESKNEIS